MAATHLAYKAANISDSLLSKISAMGATYPFVTLTINDGGDTSRLTSFSGPPDIEHLLTKRYARRRRPTKMGPRGYKYDNSEDFNSFEDLSQDPQKTGSRVVAVRVWCHKHIRGIQLVYRRPKAMPQVPCTAEDLWKKLDSRKIDETLEKKKDKNQPIESASLIHEKGDVEEIKRFSIQDKEEEEALPENIQKEEVDDRFWETTIFGIDTDEQSIMHEFNLGDNEYLTKVEISYSAILMGISLTSSSGRTMHIGEKGGTVHKFSAFPSSAIVAFFGKYGPWGEPKCMHLHELGVITEEIHPEIEGDCEVLRLLGNYTYRLKEVIPMSESKRFYIFKFQDLDDRAIQRKECLI